MRSYFTILQADEMGSRKTSRKAIRESLIAKEGIMKPAKFLMRIPANKHGYRLLEDLKSSLNSDGYKLFVRYSGKRRTAFNGHTRK